LLTENFGTGQEDSYAILRISENREGGENPHTMKTIVLETINKRKIKLMKNRSSLTIFTTILSVLGSFALLPQMQAAPQVAPPPDGCYPGFTTAEGCNALALLTTGAGNTGVGWYSLFFGSTNNFNTGVGAGTLVLNTADSNTAVGAAALLLNTTGTTNVAVGTDALVFNDSGSNNVAVGAFALFNGTGPSGDTAIGFSALENDDGGSNTGTGFQALVANTTGFNNAAFGVRSLESNVDGTNNTALGNLTLNSNVSTSNHVAVGRLAGSGITTANNNIIIGHLSGVHSVFGQVSDRCFIDNIFGAPVSLATASLVLIDSDGRLGTFTVDGPDPGGFFPKGVHPPTQANPDAHQAMMNRKVEALEATVAQLTAQLKEQAAQIQKVSAQLEVSKPAPQVVVNKP
jgi:hypothetical protein